MRICLCLREARTSENGPPPLAPAPAGTPRARGCRARAGAPRSGGRAARPQHRGRGGQPRPERVSVPRGLRRRHRRQGPAAAHSRAHHAQNRQNRRSSLHRRPTPPSASRPYSRFLARPIPASLRVASMVDPPSQIRHQPTHHAPPARCRRPAPGPPAPAWANPHHIYLARRGRGVRREAADPPSSKAQAGSEKQAGGGAAACRAPKTNTKKDPNTGRRTPRTIPRVFAVAHVRVATKPARRSFR